MLKKHHVVLCLLAAFSFVMVMGCAQPPTEEMAKAEKAVADAKAKEANLYAADAFKKAEDALKKAKDQVAAKQYKEAKQAALDTAALAQQALAGVEAGKAKMKEEAAKTAADVQKAYDELKADVAAAVKKKKLAAKDKDEVQAALDKWTADLTAVKTKLDAGKIGEALGEYKAMLKAIGAKKEDVAKLVAAAPAAPEKKKKKK